MYTIPSAIYEKAAQNLCDQVGSSSYFSGSIAFTHEDVECRMVLSLIIYHKRTKMPEGRVEMIEDLVPVWWEFHTEIGGEEILNDFDFAILKEYII